MSPRSSNWPGFVAACDWSVDPVKRQMATAEWGEDGHYRIGPPRPVGDAATLIDRAIGKSPAGTALIGFDFPIGLPRTYARRAGLPSFRAALAQFGGDAWPRVYDPTDQPSLDRPFYPATVPGPGQRRQAVLLDGLGGAADGLIHRRCDRPAGGASLFWLIGPNQVGRATIHGWRTVLGPGAGWTRIWPFDGPLKMLLADRGVVLAEVYPAAAYRFFGLPIARAGKRKADRGARRQCAGPLIAQIDRRSELRLTAAARRAVISGFASDDAFDAFVGLLWMLEIVCGYVAPGDPTEPEIRDVEGWILGLSWPDAALPTADPNETGPSS